MDEKDSGREKGLSVLKFEDVFGDWYERALLTITLFNSLFSGIIHLSMKLILVLLHFLGLET